MGQLENTRFNVEDDFESFKQKRLAADAAAAKLKAAENQNPAAQPVENQIENNQEVSVTADEIQAELSLNEPPADAEPPETVNTWTPPVAESRLQQWWAEFNETQTVRISSLLKSLVPTIRGNEVVIVVPPKKTELLESVRYPFNRFIAEKSEGKLTNLLVEAGEYTETERKPYTDKEKLEHLLKLHPVLEDVVKKLGLRLP